MTKEATEQTTTTEQTAAAEPRTRKPRTPRTSEGIIQDAHNRKSAEVAKLETRLEALDDERVVIRGKLADAYAELKRLEIALGKPTPAGVTTATGTDGEVMHGVVGSAE